MLRKRWSQGDRIRPLFNHDGILRCDEHSSGPIWRITAGPAPLARSYEAGRVSFPTLLLGAAVPVLGKLSGCHASARPGSCGPLQMATLTATTKKIAASPAIK
jgi:hypothetical protein